MQRLVTTNNATGERTVTFYSDAGEQIETINSTHLRHREIMAEVDAAGREARELDEARITKLLRPADAIADRLATFTDQFTSVNGNILYQGMQMDGVAAKQLLAILRSEKASDKDVRAFVRFNERLMLNESRVTRDALAAWVADRDLTILPDGRFLAYKGCMKDADGNIVSVFSGPANLVAVNGVLQPAGKVPNPIGAVVTMERRFVDDNRNQHCSQGLHTGQYEYARDWGKGVLLLVAVDPADVVSVPPDHAAQKMRTCRYQVLEITEYIYPHAVYRGRDDDYDYEDEDTCDECGNYDCTCDDCGDCGEHTDDCTCDDDPCDGHHDYEDGACLDCGAECDHGSADRADRYCPDCGERL